jgi:hypothetical protein
MTVIPILDWIFNREHDRVPGRISKITDNRLFTVQSVRVESCLALF